MLKKISVIMATLLVIGVLALPVMAAQEGKIGYVDLRKAFYEYEKTKTFEDELNKITDDRQKDRNTKVEKVTKLRDEMELSSGSARNNKQKQVEDAITDLNEFDLGTRQMLLNKKNDMFRQVIDDIQKVVEDIGKKGNYDFVLDSRNIMYSQEKFDLTEEVIKRLNK
ncbi:MAG: OmpH family outer membrane protein [Candidatus Omnitrophota bacterium]